MSIVKANTYQDASGGSNAVFSGVASPPNSMGFRNRIINGNMVIDQRNAGASVTVTGNPYTLDRWYSAASVDGKYTVQQNAGSVTPPAGYTNYLGCTVGASANVTVGAGDYFGIRQAIEGYNVSDFGFGAATASTVTLSFWVRSSVTGTYGATLKNSASNRSYPFTYAINSANTWEQKSVTVAGDTTGTWLTTNGVGLYITFGLGVGATYSGTAGAWAASNLWSATGATNWIQTNSATFYITGVQLESGTVASPFERRDYGRELAMCQRYYQKSFPIGTAPAQNAGTTGAVYSQSPAASGSAPTWVNFAVVMRDTPSTVTFYNPSAANANWRNINAGTDVNSQLYSSSQSSIYIIGNTQTVGQYQIVAIHYSASSEL